VDLKILVSDLQIPWHHKRACNALLNMIADRRRDITEVFQVGDFYEFSSVSRWASGTVKEDGRTLQREINEAETLLAGFAEAYPHEKLRIMGNHDDRLGKYLNSQARGLHGLDCLEFDTFTQAARFGWRTIPQPYSIAPNTTAVHGLSVRSKAGYTAHSHLDKLGTNVVHGHTHRAALVYRTIGDRTIWGMEIGGLCDRKSAPYGVGGIFDWQLAFGALWIDGRDVWPQLVTMRDDGSFLFDGRRYKA
jgi:hypothetical protein